ncbi:hypothetical protein K435DRAFT_474006 [Dendrothele bispora CBS 962.96]|uniref:Extracellular membrane protein CFEM domain-containing protein n=1 Tax=Dendrothele bispora (strain CBS 962.96) TaxID=1314807 RepID=A0A4S8MCE4_DENBC|nr:hypothetical protein K435DRAFT_474006 [Dendrothele bispora CBS 962.96]
MPSIKLLPAAVLLAGHVLAMPIGQQQSATSDSNTCILDGQDFTKNALDLVSDAALRASLCPDGMDDDLFYDLLKKCCEDTKQVENGVIPGGPGLIPGNNGQGGLPIIGSSNSPSLGDGLGSVPIVGSGSNGIPSIGSVTDATAPIPPVLGSGNTQGGLLSALPPVLSSDNGQGDIPVLSPVLGQASNAGPSDGNLINTDLPCDESDGSPSNGNVQVPSVGTPITGKPILTPGSAGGALLPAAIVPGLTSSVDQILGGGNPVLPVSVNTPSGSGEGLGNIVSGVIPPSSPVTGTPGSSGSNCIENLCHDLANLENGNVLPAVDGAVQSVVNNAVPAVGNLVNNAVPTVDNVVNDVVPTVDNTVNSAVPTVGNAVNGVVPTVDGAVNGAVPTVDGAVNGVVPTVNGAVNGVVPTVNGAVNGVVPTVNGAVNGVVPAIDNTLNNVVDDVDKTLSSVTVNAPGGSGNSIPGVTPPIAGTPSNPGNNCIGDVCHDLTDLKNVCVGHLITSLLDCNDTCNQQNSDSWVGWRKAGANDDCMQNAPDGARLVHKFQENDGDLSDYICAYYDSCQAMSNVNNEPSINANEKLTCVW